MNCQYHQTWDNILYGKRIVIPKKLRQQAIQLAHHGHQGLVKTKKLLREKEWFSGIERCLPSQSVGIP